ncbi:MAG TPA: efflux RND transporter periplasmic adaptor subunit [Anaeromyxobacteraceae bacterium]|jgi:multidrug efflux system membrane fusion protein|nr:efflux RND transporter periplasmic adaptor subunit [Anaeromyxobacteraceae bacterium]
MRTKRWVGAAVGLVVLGALLLGLRSRSGGNAPGTAKGPDPRQSRAIPVAAAAATARDVPIYLEGLGSVTAFKTVTVRAQVDGRLDQVLFAEGQPVRRGQVLAQIDPRPFRIQLDQAEGALARDEAQLRNSQVNERRYRELADQKLIASQQFTDQEAQTRQLEGAVRMDRAAIDSARLNLDYARITSPIDGVTGVRLVDPGNLVRASDQGGIVLVTQLDPIAVLFTLPQDELSRVAAELARGPLPVEAWSRDGATLLGKGKVTLIDNQINQTTGTLRLKAVLPNPGRQLWPNQFVKARLLLTTRRGALTAPATAVQRGPSGAFVYVIGGDDTVTPRTVEVDSTQGDLAIFTKGLAPGERVVTDGQNQLRPGAKVATREPGAPVGKSSAR